MKHDKLHHLKYRYTGIPGCRLSHASYPYKKHKTDTAALTTLTTPRKDPADVHEGVVADTNLLDELQALLGRLGAAKIFLTLYLVEFGGLPRRLARPLLQEAAGSCAILRLPAVDRHLVIYLGPEPSAEYGGFLGRLQRGLTALSLPNETGSTWAEVRSLRRCNHDVAAPAYMLLDLSAAAPRVVGVTDW